MSIKTDWTDNQKTILLSVVQDGSQAWNEVESNAERVHELAMSVNYPVALIVVLARTMSIPPSGFVQNSRDVIANHTALGFHTIVYVTPIPYTMTLWQETLDALAPDRSRYFVAGDIEEALDIVASRAG